MNGPNLVTGAELGRLLRPAKPWNRVTIWQWTCAGRIPKQAVVSFGRRVLYSVPQLIAAGWLQPGAGAEAEPARG